MACSSSLPCPSSSAWSRSTCGTVWRYNDSPRAVHERGQAEQLCRRGVGWGGGAEGGGGSCMQHAQLVWGVRHGVGRKRRVGLGAWHPHCHSCWLAQCSRTGRGRGRGWGHTRRTAHLSPPFPEAPERWRMSRPAAMGHRKSAAAGQGQQLTSSLLRDAKHSPPRLPQPLVLHCSPSP